MSDTLDLTSISTEEPAVTEVVEDVAPEEPAEEPDEVATEEPAEEPEEVTPEEPAEEPEEVTPEESTEVATEEPEATPEEPAEVPPVEQVASDIRSILTEVPTTPVESVESVESVVSDQLCSLKTLIDVLGKWSSKEIRRGKVEDLLKEGTEVDDNLDDLEKVVEILQLWITEGGSIFREHNHFKNLDEYTLVGESRDLSEEKKVEVLKKLTELTVNVSHRRKSNEEIQNVMNNLY